jgi:hypothetical protein
MQEELFEQGSDELEESEVSQLFIHALSEVTEHMDAEEANAYLREVLEGGTLETELLFGHITSEHGNYLNIPSYHPDTAVREASLAPKSWKSNEEGELAYQASNEMEVYLGSEDSPLDVGEALSKIRQFGATTVLTARVVLGLWNSRRHNKQVSQNGSVAILLDEILAWLGAQKHSRTAHPGANKRYTDGYRSEQKQRLLQALALLASYKVRGSCPLTIKGKTTLIEIDGPYIRYDTVRRKTAGGEKIAFGILVAPGGWISTYEQHQFESLAQIDRQIFRLNPQNDRYALLLSLYLTERWRGQTQAGSFSEPIRMTHLLAASMIEVDKRHLTSEIAPRIEAALRQLEEMGIIGKHLCLTPVDKTKARWAKEWLDAQWEILPPAELIRTYRVHQRKRRQTPLKEGGRPF